MTTMSRFVDIMSQGEEYVCSGEDANTEGALKDTVTWSFASPPYLQNTELGQFTQF